MPTPDELLLVTKILDRIGEDRSALDGWRQTEDDQKVIQYVVQIGKYNTNLGEGKGIYCALQPLYLGFFNSLIDLN